MSSRVRNPKKPEVDWESYLTGKLVAGIDLSYTSTGMVVMDSSGRYQQRSIGSKPVNDTAKAHRQRVAILAEAVEAFVTTYKPALIMIEGYAYAAKGNVVKMAELGGVVRYVLDKHAQIIDVSPATLKKFVCTGKDRKKENVLLDAYKRWGETFDSNDLCDAYVLARIGNHLLHDKEVEVAAMREVIAMLRKQHFV